MVGAGGVEWSDHMAITALELHVYCWRTGFGRWLGITIIPGAVLDDVYHSDIIDQIKATALADSDGWLHEVCIAHVNIDAASASRTTATRDNQNSDKGEYYKTDYKLFHGVCFSPFGKSVIKHAYMLDVWRSLLSVRGSPK
jgi:hypothetical protein